MTNGKFEVNIFIVYCKRVMFFISQFWWFIFPLLVFYYLFYNYSTDESLTGVLDLNVYFGEPPRHVSLHILPWKTTHQWVNIELFVWWTNDECVNIDCVLWRISTTCIANEESHSFISQCPLKTHVIYIFISVGTNQSYVLWLYYG